ncbi:hypothetical protein CC84DRAFT_1089656, partial [Paraphaeosphaeria sporulosa]
SFTYDHRTLRIGLPVRSALHKQCTGGSVVRWVTTGESPLLYVFANVSHHFLCCSSSPGAAARFGKGRVGFHVVALAARMCACSFSLFVPPLWFILSQSTIHSGLGRATFDVRIDGPETRLGITCIVRKSCRAQGQPRRSPRAHGGFHGYLYRPSEVCCTYGSGLAKRLTVPVLRLVTESCGLYDSGCNWLARMTLATSIAPPGRQLNWEM